MAVETLQAIPCPPNDELRKMLKGKLADERQANIENHLDDCTGCRSRLELMADAETNLSDIVKHIDKDKPANDSAYWSALNQIEAEANVTSTFAAYTNTPTDTSKKKIDFLRPSDKPGMIGKLGEFEIIREIGRGGMGVVLQALDPHLDREVAIKVLDPQMSSNDMARQRFCREARAAAAVVHDHIVTVFQVNEDEAAGLPYLVMQLIKGESLEEKIRRQGKLGVSTTVRYAMQAAQGLAAAHAAGLIHRDIKPGNILIEEATDKATLTDFGLARAVEDLKLTRTGFVAGTPLYMAPEQARGDNIDTRADLFSLGSVMYEALAGKPPFDGKTPLAVLRRVADEAHPRLSRINPLVPDWLEDVIDQLLEKKPEHRVESAEELGRILASQYCSLEPDGNSPPPVECTVARSASRLMGRRRKSALTTALVLAIPFLLGGLAGAALGYGLAPESREVINNVPVPTPGFVPPGTVGPEGPEPIKTLTTSNGAIWSVASAKDGNTIVAGLEDGSFIVWNLDTRAIITSKANAHDAPILSVDISQDGKTVITGGDDGVVKIWDVTGAAKIRGTFDNKTAVRSVALDSSGSRVVTGDRGGMVRIWMIGEDKFLREFMHGGTISAVAFAPDSLTVGSASTNKTVILWDVPNGRSTFTFTAHQGPVYGIAFSPDGQLVATAGWDKSVIIWEARNGEIKHNIKTAHDDGVTSVAFASCGSVLASAATDGSVKVWNVSDGSELNRFSRHKGTVHSVKFLPNCTTLMTGGRDGTVRAWAVK
ncbi:hypothetical protein BH11PLA2_BH11PLA2_38620 [soil metagenome]